MTGPNRRDFVRAAGAFALTAAGLNADDRTPRLKKAIKYGMVRIDGSDSDKFRLARRVGFEGVEVDSPNTLDRDAVLKASEETGVAIHGIINSVHWQTRLSDPDPGVRARGLEALKGALKDAKFFGADTVLLVPGAVRDPDRENFDQVWERSTAEVKKAIPLAEELGVKIAIEVVWNDFITTPKQLIEYVDQFETEAVGAYFDCSNVVRYGVPSAEWIKALGGRMLKFDFKGFDMNKYEAGENPWVKIGEGTEDWPAIREALAGVGYHGWATSEVSGGGEEWLREVSRRMDEVLGLG